MKNFYAVGECAGTFGVYRPGGSALNSTQTGSLFAALDIAEKRIPAEMPSENHQTDISHMISVMDAMSKGDMTRDEVLAKRLAMGKRMSDSAAFLRNAVKINQAIADCKSEIFSFTQTYRVCEEEALYDALINLDILETQLTYLNAIRDYIRNGGKSRGSYLIITEENPDLLTLKAEIDTAHATFVQNTILEENLSVTSFFEPVRPLPKSEQWFEKVYTKNNHKGNETT